MLSKVVSLVLVVLVIRGSGTPVKSPLRRNGSGRIVGGVETDIRRFPYQVGLDFLGSFHCGGSIYSTRVIITAADCVAGYPPYMLSLFAGTSSSLDIQSGLRREIEKIIYHEKFNFDTHDFDIGLVFLTKPLYYTETIQPIGLASRNEYIPPGTKALIAGWGTLHEEGGLEEKLHYAAVSIVDSAFCQAEYKDEEVITSSMICASGEAYGGTDPCISDFGTPLVAAGKVYGYVAFSKECTKPGRPRIYSNVAYLRDWIDDKLKQEGELI